MKPLSADRSVFQCSIPRRVEDKIRYAETLAPSGDLATLLELFVDAYIEKREKKKFGATSQPRSGSGHSSSPRYIPAPMKRAVMERDQGRFTFVSDAGKRCPAIRLLEYDHEVPVARGGQSTVENLRLRCRAHNQYAAECSFGAGFMSDKRAEARSRAAARVNQQETAGSPMQHAPERVEARSSVTGTAGPPMKFAPGRIEAEVVPANDRDVVPWLLKLRVRPADARRAATLCDQAMPEGSLEERLRLALRHLAPPHRKEPAMAT